MPRPPARPDQTSIHDEKGRRRCSRCRVFLDRGEFHADQTRPDGLMSACKECCKQSKAERVAQDPEGERAKRAAWKAASLRDPEKRAAHRARARAWAAANPERARATQRATQLRRKYGLTVEQFETMSRQQGGRCAICGDPPSGQRGEHLVVDHDHETGKVRGLLCARCNVMIGYALERSDVLEQAAAYLRRSELAG